LQLGPIVALAAFGFDELRGNDLAGPRLDEGPNRLALRFQPETRSTLAGGRNAKVGNELGRL
jgi:hypothetical protein